MFVPAAEISVARHATSLLWRQASRLHLGSGDWGQSPLPPMRTVPFETRPADAFLLLSDSPRDRFRAARSIARAFHKAAADFGELFQIIQIAVTRAGSVGRSARPPRSGVPI